MSIDCIKWYEIVINNIVIVFLIVWIFNWILKSFVSIRGVRIKNFWYVELISL